MLREATGAINFTIFLTLSGENLKEGTSTPHTGISLMSGSLRRIILNVFKLFVSRGSVHRDELQNIKQNQCNADEFSPEEVKNTFCVKVRLTLPIKCTLRLTLPIECTLRLTLPYRVHAASDAPLSSARCIWRSLIECTLRLTLPYRVHAASEAPLSSARCV
ncbi:hypothetical protein NQZ68_041827 [Dissostichus eleginoides]|nr:hypothetical protein NQZ68_041827 [Dissostichus eleginoides]